jgi:hypothetical protein
MLKKTLWLMLSVLFVSGCNYSVSVSSGHGHSDPELNQFDIIDTDGTNSEFEPIANLSISPFINDGEFEIFWDIRADEDYTVDFRINTNATLAGSQLIYAEHCSPGSPCHDNQFLYCDYENDFDVVCENANGDVEIGNIDRLITQIPQTLYFILDVCDSLSGYCELQAIPVLME